MLLTLIRSGIFFLLDLGDFLEVIAAAVPLVAGQQVNDREASGLPVLDTFDQARPGLVKSVENHEFEVH
jgi:hypothetical protein